MLGCHKLYRGPSWANVINTGTYGKEGGKDSISSFIQSSYFLATDSCISNLIQLLPMGHKDLIQSFILSTCTLI